jgi:profilin
LEPCVSSLPYLQADGACLVKTKQGVLVAEYVAPIQAAEATPVVEHLADYLIGVGY